MVQWMKQARAIREYSEDYVKVKLEYNADEEKEGLVQGVLQ